MCCPTLNPQRRNLTFRQIVVRPPWRGPRYGVGQPRHVGSSSCPGADEAGLVDVAGTPAVQLIPDKDQFGRLIVTMPLKDVMMSRQLDNSETHAKRAGIATAFREYREDELLDVMVSAAALLARADGWVQEVERAQLLDFLDREDFFSVFARDDVLTRFDRRVSELREPGGPSSVLRRLGRHRDGSTAALIVNVGQEIAAADCRLDPREQRVLELVRDFLDVAPRAGGAQRMIGPPPVVPRRTSAPDTKPDFSPRPRRNGSGRRGMVREKSVKPQILPIGTC